jgi:hypothetical protein
VLALLQEIVGWVLATGIAVGFASIVVSTLRAQDRGERRPPGCRCGDRCGCGAGQRGEP